MQIIADVNVFIGACYSRTVRPLSISPFSWFCQEQSKLAPHTTILPDIASDMSRTTRDPKDDYSLAYTVVFRPDYLISGDKDLLTLTAVDGIPILSPAAFVRLLRELGVLEPDPDQGPA